ncbi:MAG: DUF4384 domain-containing protein [Gemmatimonadota bacterium]
MTGRSVLAGVLAIAIIGLAQPARSQSVTWNPAKSATDTVDSAPTVQLWLEGTPSYSYGAPVRVRFNVSDDAYVLVARVDANGHLTLLYPSSRTMSAGVEGGRDIEVRGRRGGGAFYATDRLGGGFVFALASYDPFVLSRLGIRDFDRYVTGTFVGSPTRVYIGDPHEVITRFASMVSFSDGSPFDYAVEFYNVDAPYYVSSLGYSQYCGGYNSGYYRPGLAERWADQFYNDAGYGSSFGCESYPRCGGYGLANFGYSTWLGTGSSFYPVCLPNQPRNNQNPPGTPPTPDTLRVPRWLTDSIGGRTPDTVGVVPTRRAAELQEGLNSLRRGATGTEASRRPVIAADDPTDHSYAIPGRALRNSPTTIGQTRDPSSSSPLDRPGRGSATANGGAGIDWVRPPREVVASPENTSEGFLPRSPRQRENGVDRAERDNETNRGGRPSYVNPSAGRGGEVRAEPPRSQPPTRTQGPRFDSPRPTERANGSGPRYAEPPRNSSPGIDSPRPNGAGAESRGVDRSPPVRSEPVQAPPPRPAPVPVPPPVTGEKKPEKP